MKKLTLLLIPFLPFSVSAQCGDTTPPTASNPFSVSVECIANVPAIDPQVVIDEADNSGVTPVVAHVSDISDGNTCPETITRTYSVTDTCGNSIYVTQLITVHDMTPPTGSAPPDTAVAFNWQVPIPDVLDITDEADNCTANPIVAFVSEVSDGLTCPETIARTYSITDDCGNQITVSQYIFVNGVDASVSLSPGGDSLTANLSGATYQWLDCDNNFQLVTGATSQTFVPTVSGNYAVFIDYVGCADTSSCVSTLSNGWNELPKPELLLYPSPASDILTIELNNMEIQNARIYTLDGKMIRNYHANSSLLNLDISNLSEGSYLMMIQAENQFLVEKLLIKR